MKPEWVHDKGAQVRSGQVRQGKAAGGPFGDKS